MTRISLQQIFAQGLQGIQSVQSQQLKTQSQLSSGLRVQTAADDPIAAAQIMQLDQSTANITQYKKNIDGATSSLQLEDSQLNSVNTLLTRVHDLAVQAGDGSLTLSDRQAIATELQSRLQELAGLANSQSPSGEYIFGGYQGQQAPFVSDGSGGYTYRGDAGQRSVQVAASTSVPTGDSGQSLFVAVPSNRLPTSAAATNTGNATIAEGSITDQTQFQASFTGSYSISIDTTATPPTYTVTDTTSGTTVASNSYVSGQPIQFNGAQVDIVGTPGNGDTFQVGKPSTQDVFTTVNKLVTGLNSLGDNPDDKQRLTDLISETLDNLDSAQGNISKVRAQIGARLNTLTSTGSVHDSVNLINQQVLSQVRDVDYASAISQLSQESLSLQAAQQSFTKITSLSLFDFLR